MEYLIAGDLRCVDLEIMSNPVRERLVEIGQALFQAPKQFTEITRCRKRMLY